MKASDIVNPSPRTRPYVRYADKPTPDANPKGKLPQIPTIKDPMLADRAVETTMSVGNTPNLASS